MTHLKPNSAKQPESPAPVHSGARAANPSPAGERGARRRRWIGAIVWSAAALVAVSGCGMERGSSKAAIAQDTSLERVKRAGVLLWGADVVGGVPYVYEDPQHPGQYIGFEMDIARGIAKTLGVELKLVVRAWDTLIPELQRGSFDMAMNGVEDTPERATIVDFSEPYYVYSQQLTVRKKTTGVRTLADLKGKRVATLSGSAAEDILHQTPGVVAVVSPEIIYSYRDLAAAKVDAVLLDKPIAVAYGATDPRLKNVGESFNEGHYVIAFRKEDSALRLAVNRAIEKMKQTGELKAIYARYGLLDVHQQRIGVQ